MEVAASPQIRRARTSDCRAISHLYRARDAADRKAFHPFPEGRIVAPVVFFVLLTAQWFYRLLVRLHPPWGFLFVVHVAEPSGRVDGFVYLRARKNTPRGEVANIGTYVGPDVRGQGVGALLIAALVDEARKRGIRRIETEAYEWNAPILRVGEKLGMGQPEGPAAPRQGAHGVVVTRTLDLSRAPPNDGGEEPGRVSSPGWAEALPEATVAQVRRGKVSDFRALARLYTTRGETDRKLFHPFPEGRWVAPWVFFVLLTAQRLFRGLVRLYLPWGFVFVVHPGQSPGTIDAFVYLRAKRRAPEGLVANIGTLVGPEGRGKGVGPRLITALIGEARSRGVCRIETGVYDQNLPSLRMCEKLGFRAADARAYPPRRDEYGVEIMLVLDLGSEAPGTPPGASPPATIPPARSPPEKGDGTRGAGSSGWAHGARQHAPVLAALFIGFAIITYARLVLLFGSPYPPSGDVAEQLYWSHIWLGTAFPSVVTVWWIPPVYIFTVYIPFTHLFPLFTGQRLLMGVVPALLVFPTYLLLRESDVNRPFALFGAYLLALAPSVSLMVTWNAGYNLFGMFWALVFFAGLAGALRTGRRSSILLAAVGFGLTAGTHYFTFAFLCLGFVWAAVLALLLTPDRARNARTIARVFGWGLVCAAPFVLVYVTLLQQTGNVGGGITVSALQMLGQQLLPFSSGGQALWSPLLYLDAAIMIAGIVALVAVRLRKPETPVLLGILLSGITLSVAYPQEADRGLYFVPLGLYPIVAILFQIVYERIPPRKVRTSAGMGPAPTVDSSVGPESENLVPYRHWPGRPQRSWIKPLVAVTITAVFLVLNAQQSLQVMNAADQFYAELTPADLPVLNWLADHTAPNAAVFTAEPGLEPWVWGYSNRQAYAPTPLNLDATTLSYQVTYSADLAALGQNVVGDPYLAVAQNSPALVGAPLVYLRTAYDWNLLLSTGEANVNFTVTVGGVPEQFSLASAQFVSGNASGGCPGCAAQESTFSWPSIPLTIVQRTNVSGESVQFSWSATGGQIDSVSLTTYLVPSSFGATYLSVPSVNNASALTDQFSLAGDPLSMTIGATSANIQQRGLATGWTVIEVSGGPQLTVSFQGLAPYGDSTPYSMESGSILSGLGVSYIVTDYNDSVPGFGYLTYLRCVTPDEIPGVSVTQVFQSGSLYIFELDPA